MSDSFFLGWIAAVLFQRALQDWLGLERVRAGWITHPVWLTGGLCLLVVAAEMILGHRRRRHARDLELERQELERMRRLALEQSLGRIAGRSWGPDEPEGGGTQ